MNSRVLLYLHLLAIENPTGIHRYSLELARALAAQHRADLMIELWAGDVLSGADQIPDVPVRGIPGPRRLTHFSWTAVHRPMLERFTGRVDLVHQPAPTYPLPTKAPLVITVHDLLPIQRPEWYAPRVRWTFGRCVEYAVKQDAHIITGAEAIVPDIQRVYGVARERISVIPHGVQPSFRTALADELITQSCERWGLRKGTYLITVGEISRHKNASVLFEALSVLRQRGDGAPTLVVVGGDGQGADEIRTEPAQLGVADLVRFTGRLSDADLHPLLAGALGLVHPSLYEGFGLTPVEAMAAGVPTIVSSAGALPEVVADAAPVVDPTDADAWAGAIADLSDDARRLRYITLGRARAERFTWAEAARRTLTVYDECLTRSS